MIPKVGQIANEICLKSHFGEMVRLSDFRGKRNVVLAFFPLAWTPT
jgi:peroxiredoxin